MFIFSSEVLFNSFIFTLTEPNSVHDPLYIWEGTRFYFDKYDSFVLLKNVETGLILTLYDENGYFTSEVEFLDNFRQALLSHNLPLDLIDFYLQEGQDFYYQANIHQSSCRKLETLAKKCVAIGLVEAQRVLSNQPILLDGLKKTPHHLMEKN